MIEGNVENVIFLTFHNNMRISIFLFDARAFIVIVELNSTGRKVLFHNHDDFLISLCFFIVTIEFMMSFLFILDLCFNPTSMILNDVLVIKIGKNFDLIEELVDGVDEVCFALARFNFDDFEGIEMRVEFGLDFVHFGESSASDATQVDEVIFEMLIYHLLITRYFCVRDRSKPSILVKVITIKHYKLGNVFTFKHDPNVIFKVYPSYHRSKPKL